MNTPATQSSSPVRVVVVGTGNVGAAFAYALLLSGLASEIVLIDKNRAKAEGEAMDLNHAVPFAHPTRIWPGDFADCAGAAVTVLTAGALQGPGETRLDLAGRNAAIWREIVPLVVQHNPDGILLIATNAVEVLTYVTLELPDFRQSASSGQARSSTPHASRYLLSRPSGDARSMHAFIIGERGDSEVPV